MYTVGTFLVKQAVRVFYASFSAELVALTGDSHTGVSRTTLSSTSSTTAI